MRISSIAYQEYLGTPREWTLDPLSLGPVNLIVGKNASGKTRTLNVLRNLAFALGGKAKVSLDGQFDVNFVGGFHSETRH